MRLYSGLSTNFIRDNVHNRIAEKLKDAFFRQYRHNPAPSEVSSWRNSLRALSQVIDDADLYDHGILLEYQLPMSSKRLDCMITGQDEAQRDNRFTAFVGGRERDLLHPSAHVHQYQRYLEDSHTTFYEPPAPIALASCAYLRNYTAGDGDVLFADRFRPILNASPVFTADDVEPLQAFLLHRIREGAIGNLVVLDSALEDRALASTLNEPKDLFLLPSGSTLRALLREEDATAGLSHLNGPNIVAPFVELLLLEDLRLDFKGTRRAHLVGGRCEVPELGKSAQSVNEAYTLISTAFEPKRRSHTGNAIRCIAYQDATSGAWHRLERLRGQLEAQWEAESLGPQGS